MTKRIYFNNNWVTQFFLNATIPSFPCATTHIQGLKEQITLWPWIRLLQSLVINPFDLSDHKTPNKCQNHSCSPVMITLTKIMQFDLGSSLFDLEKITLWLLQSLVIKPMNLSDHKTPNKRQNHYCSPIWTILC